MIIAINGYADITEAFAHDLLVDFVKAHGPAYYMAPEQDKDPDGLRNAWAAVESVGSKEPETFAYTLWNYFEQFTQTSIVWHGNADKYFFCLGTEQIEQDIQACLDNNIPVLDLTRALYPITTIGEM